MKINLAAAFIALMACQSACFAAIPVTEPGSDTPPPVIRPDTPPVTPPATQPGGYGTGNQQGSGINRCSNPSQRDAVCIGYANKVGMRPTDNIGGGLQSITNARAIPEKPGLTPLSLVPELLKKLPRTVNPALCSRKPELCEGYEQP